MLDYAAILFLVLAVIVGLLGFTGIALITIEIARILVIVFLILFVITLVLHLMGVM